jgi:hypothetical protein
VLSFDYYCRNVEYRSTISLSHSISISRDYHEYNTNHLTELEAMYKNQLDRIYHEYRQEPQLPKKSSDIRSTIESTKNEHRLLIEKNHSLTKKLGRIVSVELVMTIRREFVLCLSINEYKTCLVYSRTN